MKQWTQVAYEYDGTFAGFLTCVFESYLNREEPACFHGPQDLQASLWPERVVDTHEEHAKRVYRSLRGKLGVRGWELVTVGFLTCLEEKELHLWRFLKLGYERGPGVVRELGDDRVHILFKAVQAAQHEAQLYRGFVRFSEQNKVLVSEIEPKNRVLPLLRRHFCDRYAGECFAIHDRTHGEVLLYERGQWAILSIDEFKVDAPGAEERDYRALWRRFYDTIAIEGRYNPKCRMTHMPKRYWNMLTEFQTDPEDKGDAPALEG